MEKYNEGVAMYRSPFKTMHAEEYFIEKYKIDIWIPKVEIPGVTRTDLYKDFAKIGFKRGAEIGVLRGWNACRICQSIPGVKLYCVDPWRHYSGHIRGRSTDKQTLDMQNAVKSLAAYDVEFYRQLSMDAVKSFGDNSLDFVYIDGHHIFDYVMEDIIEWAKRVRPGGIVAGHDYFIPNKSNRSGVVEAVNAYVGAHEIPNLFVVDIETETPSWFFIKI